MRIHILTTGTHNPAWVEAGFDEYAKRMPAQCAFVLRQIPSPRPGKSEPATHVVERDGEALLRAIPKNCRVVALDASGEAWDTRRLAQKLRGWMQMGQDLCLLIGGADGLSEACLQRADESWSLSPLTFPHSLVRVIVAEQLYRAWTVVNNHPYHRE